jgi:hypothetical protein
MPTVGAVEYGMSRLSAFGGVAALIAGGAMVAWLVGLVIVLHGSKPGERSEIIRAYALCNPLGYLRRSTVSGREGLAPVDDADSGTADGGSEAHHESPA